eukprot:8640587-Pyramimonas_sp.AAC.1
MRSQSRDYVAWLLLHIGTQTDSAGAKKTRLQLMCACNDEDVPASWISASRGRSFRGVVCPESMCAA